MRIHFVMGGEKKSRTCGIPAVSVVDAAHNGQCGKPVRVHVLCLCRGYSHWLGSDPVCTVGGLSPWGVKASV